MASGFDSAEFGDTRRVAAPRPEPEPSAAGPGTRTDAEWMTVRQAAEETGVPEATIRGWHRRGRVTGRKVDGDRGPRIELLALEVRDLAETRQPRRRGTSPSTTSTAPGTDPVETPAGVLVPLDSWQQLLRQLGNLHEAGRDLADARERAAKAETEARFLRERLAELRAQVAETRAEPVPVPPATPAPSGVDRSAGMKVVTKLGRALRPRGRRRP